MSNDAERIGEIEDMAAIAWSEACPGEPGLYLWFREEYDMARWEKVLVRTYADTTRYVGGQWYGPIPMPKLEGTH